MTDRPAPSHAVAALAAVAYRVGQCADVDAVITQTLDELCEQVGLEHSSLLLLDETATSLYTIASHGYEDAGIGSEVRFGEGVIGRAAAEGRPVRVNNLQRMLVYARSVRRTMQDAEIALPALPSANSQLAAPAIALGRLVGVLVVESEQMGAFTLEDENMLAVVAHLLASAILLDRVDTSQAPSTERDTGAPRRDAASAVSVADAPVATLRFFTADGSTFIDDEYLIKGVAGRILWRLVTDHIRDGRTEFSNREVRLDPALELPAYKDNLENRLILLKRRLDDRNAPMRITRTGRGRFRLDVEGSLRTVIDGAQ